MNPFIQVLLNSVDGGWWMVDGEESRYLSLFTIHHPPSTIHHLVT